MEERVQGEEEMWSANGSEKKGSKCLDDRFGQGYMEERIRLSEF